MNKALPLSITVEEAVARMVNMDYIYIPTEFTLLDMTGAFLEEAESYYENACIDQLPENQITSLRIRMETCEARHALARHLLESLQHEINNLENSIIVLADGSPDQIFLSMESVSDWANEKYGISIPIWDIDLYNANKDTKKIKWEDVTIKIKKGYKIEVFIGNKKRNSSDFRNIGLMGKKKDLPNQEGKKLIGLSMGKIYIKQGYKSAENKSIHCLRYALKKLTGLPDDPFYEYNKENGWKPRFKLVDKLFNYDIQYEGRIKRECYDDSRRYICDLDD